MGPQGLEGCAALTTELLLLIVAILLSSLLALLVLVILFLGSLPIRTLKQVAGSLQRLLSMTLGDSYVLSSPVRRTGIVSTVGRVLNSLSQFHALAVVAHSQGAAVAFEALRAERPASLARFITFGSGLAKLRAIDHLRAARTRYRVWLAPFALVGLIFVGWLTIQDLRSGETDVLISSGW